MKTIEELRREFEETDFFKNLESIIDGINYKSKGGYFVDGDPYFYLNGAFNMFQEFKK